MIETLQTIATSVSSGTDWLGYRSIWQDRKDTRHTSPSSASVLYDLQKLPQYSLSEVFEHCTSDDCWIVVYDRVYDVTKFLDSHPGGHYIIMEHAGRDATLVFRGSRHSDDAFEMLHQYLVGVLIESERLYLNDEHYKSSTENIAGL